VRELRGAGVTVTVIGSSIGGGTLRARVQTIGDLDALQAY
jgi:hypothetical protein